MYMLGVGDVDFEPVTFWLVCNNLEVGTFYPTTRTHQPCEIEDVWGEGGCFAQQVL